jgi:isoaspartyl peptidase/L-asparaginase-like protein (Ntn-hydrolase superfamily)
MLVAEGARSFAAARNFDMVDTELLVSPTARTEWQSWRMRHQSLNQPLSSSSLTDIQDTVGAVALSLDGDLAAGVSRYGLSRSK